MLIVSWDTKRRHDVYFQRALPELRLGIKIAIRPAIITREELRHVMYRYKFCLMNVITACGRCVLTKNNHNMRQNVSSLHLRYLRVTRVHSRYLRRDSLNTTCIVCAQIKS